MHRDHPGAEEETNDEAAKPTTRKRSLVEIVNPTSTSKKSTHKGSSQKQKKQGRSVPIVNASTDSSLKPDNAPVLIRQESGSTSIVGNDRSSELQQTELGADDKAIESAGSITVTEESMVADLHHTVVASTISETSSSSATQDDAISETSLSEQSNIPLARCSVTGCEERELLPGCLDCPPIPDSLISPPKSNNDEHIYCKYHGLHSNHVALPKWYEGTNIKYKHCECFYGCGRQIDEVESDENFMYCRGLDSSKTLCFGKKRLSRLCPTFWCATCYASNTESSEASDKPKAGELIRFS